MPEQKHFIIAVDGPAAAGKGTLSRNIAAHLHYAHMDTGALYRAVALSILNARQDPADENIAIAAAKELNANFTADRLTDSRLRKDETGSAASKIAPIKEVREILIDLQRNFAKNPPITKGSTPYKGSVLDGRDIGTVICPNADAKIYIIADVEIRAKRRTKELHSKGLDATYDTVLTDMRQRDERDAERKQAPMKPADDAFVLDTSKLSEIEVFDKAINFINSSLNAHS